MGGMSEALEGEEKNHLFNDIFGNENIFYM